MCSSFPLSRQAAGLIILSGEVHLIICAFSHFVCRFVGISQPERQSAPVICTKWWLLVSWFGHNVNILLAGHSHYELCFGDTFPWAIYLLESIEFKNKDRRLHCTLPARQGKCYVYEM